MYTAHPPTTSLVNEDDEGEINQLVFSSIPHKSAPWKTGTTILYQNAPIFPEIIRGFKHKFTS